MENDQRANSRGTGQQDRNGRVDEEWFFPPFFRGPWCFKPWPVWRSSRPWLFFPIFWGITLTLGGSLWLLSNMGLLPDSWEEVFWPMAAICLGLSMIARFALAGELPEAENRQPTRPGASWPGERIDTTRNRGGR